MAGSREDQDEAKSPVGATPSIESEGTENSGPAASRVPTDRQLTDPDRSSNSSAEELFESRTDEAGAARAIRPERLLVPAPGSIPTGLRPEWWIEAYDEDKYGASLYLLDEGDPSDTKVGQLVDLGAWWLSQSIGQGYLTEFEGPVWRRRSKQVVVRGHDGLQLKTELDGSESPVCLLFWNEPSSGPEPLRYVIASPESTCADEQVAFANNLRTAQV